MFLVKQRAVATLQQRPLLVAVLFAVFQVMLASLSSSSTDLLQVFTGLPTFLLPCGFHSRACLEHVANPILFAPGDLCWNTFLLCTCLRFPDGDFLWPDFVFRIFLRY